MYDNCCAHPHGDGEDSCQKPVGEPVIFTDMIVNALMKDIPIRFWPRYAARNLYDSLFK